METVTHWLPWQLVVSFTLVWRLLYLQWRYVQYVNRTGIRGTLPVYEILGNSIICGVVFELTLCVWYGFKVVWYGPLILIGIGALSATLVDPVIDISFSTVWAGILGSIGVRFAGKGSDLGSDEKRMLFVMSALTSLGICPLGAWWAIASLPK